VVLDLQQVAHVDFARGFGGLAVRLDSAEFARSRGQRTRLEEPRRPQPLVDSNAPGLHRFTVAPGPDTTMPGAAPESPEAARNRSQRSFRNADERTRDALHAAQRDRCAAPRIPPNCISGRRSPGGPSLKTAPGSGFAIPSPMPPAPGK